MTIQDSVARGAISTEEGKNRFLAVKNNYEVLRAGLTATRSVT